MAKVAFLGLGAMGAPMAVNLVLAGFDVMCWNRTLSRSDIVKNVGGTVGKSPTEAVEGADFILSIFDSGQIVQEVFFDNNIIDHMKSGAVFIDMAFISPTMAKRHAKILDRRKIGYLDAPVSGGSPGAVEGSLAIMVGGKIEDFVKVISAGIFSPLGRSCYMGPTGNGQIAKLVNQIMVTVNVSGVAQALLLSSACGVDPAQIPEALLGGRGDSRILQEYRSELIDHNFLKDLKDLNTVLEIARDFKIKLPIVEAARDALKNTCQIKL